MVTIFSFDHMTAENRELRETIQKITREHQLSLNGPDCWIKFNDTLPNSVLFRFDNVRHQWRLPCVIR